MAMKPKTSELKVHLGLYKKKLIFYLGAVFMRYFTGIILKLQQNPSSVRMVEKIDEQLYSRPPYSQ